MAPSYRDTGNVKNRENLLLQLIPYWWKDAYFHRVLNSTNHQYVKLEDVLSDWKWDSGQISVALPQRHIVLWLIIYEFSFGNGAASANRYQRRVQQTIVKRFTLFHLCPWRLVPSVFSHSKYEFVLRLSWLYLFILHFLVYWHGFILRSKFSCCKP